jgi:hypothetical protein
MVRRQSVGSMGVVRGQRSWAIGALSACGVYRAEGLRMRQDDAGAGLVGAPAQAASARVHGFDGLLGGGRRGGTADHGERPLRSGLDVVDRRQRGGVERHPGGAFAGWMDLVAQVFRESPVSVAAGVQVLRQRSPDANGPGAGGIDRLRARMCGSPR